MNKKPLDLSATFDTVDHKKLLNILKTEILIDGNALKWFESFLCGRCQKVKIGNFESEEIIIKFGVPQGSVLGPVLFNIYIRSLYKTVQSQRFSIQGFADDHQVYKSFQLNREYAVIAHEVPTIFREIEKWMAYHFLQINPGKTEAIVFASAHVLAQLQLNGCFITPSICIRFVNTAKNLGIRLDSRLTFKDQIKTLKMSCFLKLCQIKKMRPYLAINQIQTLVQASVLLSLDYCNSLYYGICTNMMMQLQVIQNHACRTIFGLKKQETPINHLKKLHWLKVNERIQFKILLLVYKSLVGLAPIYIQELLSYNNTSGSRLLSLHTPVSKSRYGERAFSFSAPKLWNNLPYEIKQAPNIESFKRRLKHHLFMKSYTAQDDELCL